MMNQKSRLILVAFFLIISSVIYFIENSAQSIGFLALGLIWNYSYFEMKNRQTETKKFSTSKIILFLQNLIQSKTSGLPQPLRLITDSLPSVFFVGSIAFINDSDISWWWAFFGSFIFEISLKIKTQLA